MIDLLDKLSILLGFIAVCYPLYWAWYFYRMPIRLSKAVGFMFFGEAWGMATTTVFAILALTDMLVDLSGIAQALMRIAMFTMALATSHYLASARRAVMENGS